MATSGRRCGFCRIELEPAGGRGRPPIYCSKACRQHDYRERKKLVSGATSRRWRRRRDARQEAELQRLLEQPNPPNYFEAREQARKRSWQAWLRPGRLEDWSIYVAALDRAQAREGISS